MRQKPSVDHLKQLMDRNDITSDISPDQNGKGSRVDPNTYSTYMGEQYLECSLIVQWYHNECLEPALFVTLWRFLYWAYYINQLPKSPVVWCSLNPICYCVQARRTWLPQQWLDWPASRTLQLLSYARSPGTRRIWAVAVTLEWPSQRLVCPSYTLRVCMSCVMYMSHVVYVL